MPVASIVDWYGPLKTFAEFRAELREWEDGTRTLYAALDESGEIVYVGLTTTPRTRANNHKLKAISNYESLTYMVGEIATAKLAGRRLGRQPSDLALMEKFLIWHLQPRLNETAHKTPPEDCVSIFSRFFDIDDPERPVRRPKGFPIFLGYDSWAEKVSAKV